MVKRIRHRRLKAKEIDDIKAKLLQKQGHRCPLCRLDLKGADSKDKCLDHNHVTGHIRAVLCRNCNAMEGKIHNCARRAKRDGTVLGWLENLMQYHAHHAKNPEPYLHPSHRTEEEKRVRRNKKARKRRAASKK